MAPSLGQIVLAVAALTLIQYPMVTAGAAPGGQMSMADSVLRVRVVESGTNRPVSEATVLLQDASGNRRAGGFTNQDGRFQFSLGVTAGDVLRVERLGYAPLVQRIEGGATGPTELELRLIPQPVLFTGIEVTVESRCTLNPLDAGQTYALWESTRIALQAAELTESEGLAQYRTRSWRYQINQEETQVERRTMSDQLVAGRTFETLDPRELATRGYVEETFDGERIMHGPDARVLLSTDFADSHCFRIVDSARLEEEQAAGERWVGLAFEPAPEPANVIRIGGTLWLDRASGELRQVQFQYRWYEPRRQIWAPWGAGSGGTIRYRGLDDGRWIIEWWELRALSQVRRSGIWYDVAGGMLLEVMDRVEGGRP